MGNVCGCCRVISRTEIRLGCWRRGGIAKPANIFCCDGKGLWTCWNSRGQHCWCRRLKGFPPSLCGWIIDVWCYVTNFLPLLITSINKVIQPTIPWWFLLFIKNHVTKNLRGFPPSFWPIALDKTKYSLFTLPLTYISASNTWNFTPAVLDPPLLPCSSPTSKS